MVRYKALFASFAAGALLALAGQGPAQAAAPAAAATPAAATAGCGKAPGLASGSHTISGGGQNRSYILRVPDNYDNNHPYRLFVGLHWRGGTANDVDSGGTDGYNWSYYGLRRLADNAGNNTIFVAPQGNGNGWANPGGQDVTFIDDLLRRLEAALCVEFDSSTQPPGPPVPTGVNYRLVAQHSGKLVEIAGASTAAGALVQQWSATGGLNQQFDFVSSGDGYYRVRARHSGLVLQAATADSGADIAQQADSGAAGQQWWVVDQGGGAVSLVNRLSGLALDVWGVSTGDGARISQWTFTGNPNQRFQLQRA